MWLRETFHACANELMLVSEDFRSAYLAGDQGDQSWRTRVMQETSMRGVEILRILALSIRSDQDYGLTDFDETQVGSIRANVPLADVPRLVHTYQPPHNELQGFAPLRLRQALNKIAHLNPGRTSFFADENNHDIILTGQDRDSNWVAIISLLQLCSVVKRLPDAAIQP
jgi:hypothetical protein